MERIQCLRRHIGRNILGKFILELVSTLGLSLSKETGSKIVDRVVALGLNLGWGKGCWHLACKRVN